jgi:hypothetical protein
VGPATFYIIPLCLYFFGSVLTDKPYASDLDLLPKYRERPELDPRRSSLSAYHRKAGLNRASDPAFTPQDEERSHRHLYSTVEQWLEARFFTPDTDVRLVWEPGR